MTDATPSYVGGRREYYDLVGLHGDWSEHPRGFGNLSNDEAVDLLQRLVDRIRKPEFHYFHQWKPGDMILWDNWRAMHCATGTKPGVERVIHRTTITGDMALGKVLK